MFNDPLLLIIALITVTLGSTLQSLTGFGMAVIAAPILLLINPNFLPAPILALGCTLSLLNTVRYRQQLNFGRTRIALFGRIPGSVLGVLLLALLPPVIFSISFALFIMLSVLLTYRRLAVRDSSRNLLIAGFCSGLMGTTTSIGGPPIALAYQNSSLDTARAELGTYFLVGTLISLILLLVSGHISYSQLQLTLPLLPAVFAGFGLSFLLDKHFKQQYLKPIIALLSVSASSVILVQAIRTL